MHFALTAIFAVLALAAIWEIFRLFFQIKEQDPRKKNPHPRAFVGKSDHLTGSKKDMGARRDV